VGCRCLKDRALQKRGKLFPFRSWIIWGSDWNLLHTNFFLPSCIADGQTSLPNNCTQACYFHQHFMITFFSHDSVIHIFSVLTSSISTCTKWNFVIYWGENRKILSMLQFEQKLSKFWVSSLRSITYIIDKREYFHPVCCWCM